MEATFSAKQVVFWEPRRRSATIVGVAWLLIGVAIQFFPGLLVDSEYNVLLVGLGLIFFVPGVDMLLAEFRAVVDLGTGSAYAWRRKWLLLVHRRELALDNLAYVGVGEATSTRDHLPVACVMLIASDGGELALGEWQEPVEARRVAERLSRVCHVPLMDRTFGHDLVRDQEDLGVGYVGRLQGGNETGGVTRRPQSARFSVRLRQGEVEIGLPPRGIKARDVGWLVAGAVAIGLVVLLSVLASPLWDDLKDLFSDRVLLGAAALLGLASVVIMIFGGVYLIRVAYRRVGIRASPEGLYVEARAPGWSRAWEWSADEIEEIEVADSSKAGVALFVGGLALVVQTEDTRQAFGHGLSREELHWVKNAIDAGLLGKPVEARAKEAALPEGGSAVTAAARGKIGIAPGLWPPKVRTGLSIHLFFAAIIAVWVAVLIALVGIRSAST